MSNLVKYYSILRLQLSFNKTFSAMTNYKIPSLVDCISPSIINSISGNYLHKRYYTFEERLPNRNSSFYILNAHWSTLFLQEKLPHVQLCIAAKLRTKRFSKADVSAFVVHVQDMRAWILPNKALLKTENIPFLIIIISLFVGYECSRLRNKWTHNTKQVFGRVTLQFWGRSTSPHTDNEVPVYYHIFCAS